MELRKNQPHVVLVMSDGTHYGMALKCHEEILRSWKAGEAFWNGEDNWDQPVSVKLAHVRAVFLRTPASIALALAEDEYEEEQELLKGK